MTYKTKHLYFAGVIFFIMLVSGYKGVLPVFRSTLQDYLSIGDGRFGLLFSITSLAGLSSAVYGGYFIDKWGPRRVIRLCLIGVGTGMIIIAFAGRSYLLFTIGTAWSGLFSSSLFIAVSTYLGKLFPRHQRRVLSLNLAGASFGGVMIPLIAEGLLKISGDSSSVTFAQVLHIPFIIVGMFLISASFIYRGQNNVKPVFASEDRFTLKSLSVSRSVVLLLLMKALHGAADNTLHIWMARFLESTSFFVQPFLPGIVLSSYAFSYLLSRILLATLSDRVGKRAFLIFPGILGGAIIILGILTRSYFLTAAAYVVGGFLWSFENPAIVSTILRIDKNRFGRSMGLAQLLGGVIAFILLNAVGFLTERLGEAEMWKVMLLPACIFPLVGFLGMIWSVKFYETHQAKTK